jgi:hypothetical protein
MESNPVTELIGDIVTGVYPDPHLIRERYFLTQSLYLLVFIAQRSPGSTPDSCTEVMRAAIKRMMQRSRS